MAEEFCARRDSGLHVSQPLLSSRSMQRLSLRVLLPGLVLLLFTFHVSRSPAILVYGLRSRLSISDIQRFTFSSGLHDRSNTSAFCPLRWSILEHCISFYHLLMQTQICSRRSSALESLATRYRPSSIGIRGATVAIMRTFFRRLDLPRRWTFSSRFRSISIAFRV